MVTETFHNSPAAQDIRRTTRRLERRFKGIADRFGKRSGLLGIAAFAPDAVHTDDANVLTVTNTSQSHRSHRDFVNENIKGRRIHLPATAAGEAIDKGGDSYATSRMNPDDHLVMNMPMDTDGGVHLLQLAFSRRHYNDAATLEKREGNRIQGIVGCEKKKIRREFNRICGNLGTGNSLSEALSLNVPATPNMFLMNWDLADSSAFALRSYPQIRQIILDMKRSLYDVPNTNDNVLRDEGDGQWLTYTIPEADIYNPEIPFNDVVLPAAKKILDIYGTLSLATKPRNTRTRQKPPIRIAIGLGHLESNFVANSEFHSQPGNEQREEVAGPLFWEVAALSKATTRAGQCIAVTDDILLKVPGVTSVPGQDRAVIEFRPL